MFEKQIEIQILKKPKILFFILNLKNKIFFEQTFLGNTNNFVVLL